jgi:hypothetical protein
VAKAIFQKNQRVWVPSVGAWSIVEKVVPVWAKGFDEPVRVTYDVGLGREFLAHELVPEESANDIEANAPTESWRLMRAKNKWQTAQDTPHHPFPGTYPIVVTDPNDWGGWRTPGAEYDRDPHQIERQARLIASAPRLKQLAMDLLALVAEAPEDAPPVIREMAQRASAIRDYIDDAPPAATQATSWKVA